MNQKRKTESGPDFHQYIPQQWVRHQLQQYELLRRLRDDSVFQGKWVESHVKKRLETEPSLDADWLRDLIYAYLNEFHFKVMKGPSGRPAIRIRPKFFRGKPYSWILGIPSKNLSTALHHIIESAVHDVLRGYGKGSVLTGLFGREFGSLFNRYLVRRVKEEFGK